MEFGRNGKGLVGKGQNGHWAKWESWARWLLGEMTNGRKNEIGQKGRKYIGWNGKRAKLERAKKEWAKWEKLGQNGIGQTQNKLFSKGLFPRAVKRCHCVGTG